MDGAGHFLIFWRIGLPLARAPMIAATVILFTLNWNNFLWPLLVTLDETMKTLPGRHRRLRAGDRHPYPARGLRPRHGGRHRAQRAEPVALLRPPALFHPGHRQRRHPRLSVPHLRRYHASQAVHRWRLGRPRRRGAFHDRRSGDGGAPGRDRPRRSGGCRPRRQGGPCGHEGALVAPGAGGARGAPLQARRYRCGPSRGAGPARDPGCRQAAQGFARRCRWRGDDAPLQRRRGRQDAGRDHPAGPRCGGFHFAGAAGRHRPYRALEFPARHGDPLPRSGAWPPAARRC